MEYNILGVSIQRHITIEGHEAIDQCPRYTLFVAWQSNQPSCGFMWRCTSDTTDIFPTTEAEIQHIAARGYDCRDKKLVKKLFPHLPGKALTD